MRRILLVLSVVLVIAAMVAVMAVPAFAAMPTDFYLDCQKDTGPVLVYVADAKTGQQFGTANREAAEDGFRDTECQRDIS
jgi:hypothetical protein